MSKLDEVKAEIQKLNEEHEKKVAELMATLEEPEYKRWRAEKDELYYCICAAGFVTRIGDYRSSSCDYDYDTGNYFKTEKEAKLHEKKLIAYQAIKDDAKGFEPDWSNKDQEKWFGYYNSGLGRFSCNVLTSCMCVGEIVFKAESDVMASQKKHEAEWRLLLGVED